MRKVIWWKIQERREKAEAQLSISSSFQGSHDIKGAHKYSGIDDWFKNAFER